MTVMIRDFRKVCRLQPINAPSKVANVIYPGLRIEWCMARARAMRWSEEVLLLREEMRRVLAFFDWHASWWEGRAALHENLTPQMAEGMNAYARKQAHLRRSLRTSFNHLWRCSEQLISLGIGADNDILDLREAATWRLLDLPTIDP